MPTLTTDEWLKIIGPIAGAVAGAIAGLIVGRFTEARKRQSDERRRRRDENVRKLDLTHRYLILFLASVERDSQAATPGPTEYLDKDFRLIGDVGLYEEWLGEIVAGLAAPHGGADLLRLSGLKSRLKQRFDTQHQRVQRDQDPVLADLDTPRAARLAVEFHDRIARRLDGRVT